MGCVKYITCLLLLPSFFHYGSCFPSNQNDIESVEPTSSTTGLNLQIDNQPPVHVPQTKHLLVGNCDEIENGNDQDSVIVYTDHQIVENEGPSTLNGTIEIYVDAPIKITCVKVLNQIDDDTAATPAFNAGGLGFNWVFIDVFCKYSLGFDFYIEIFGKYTNTEISDNTIN